MKRFLSFFLLSLILIPSSSFAAGDNGGGGGAKQKSIACQKKAGIAKNLKTAIEQSANAAGLAAGAKKFKATAKLTLTSLHADEKTALTAGLFGFGVSVGSDEKVAVAASGGVSATMCQYDYKVIVKARGKDAQDKSFSSENTSNISVSIPLAFQGKGTK